MEEVINADVLFYRSCERVAPAAARYLISVAGQEDLSRMILSVSLSACQAWHRVLEDGEAFSGHGLDSAQPA